MIRIHPLSFTGSDFVPESAGSVADLGGRHQLRTLTEGTHIGPAVPFLLINFTPRVPCQGSTSRMKVG
jgi:hypothetical protein